MKAFFNGIINTFDDENPLAEAMLVDGKTVIATGTNEEIFSLTGENDQVTNLKGKRVIPSLIDGHTHPSMVAKTFWHATVPLTYDRNELLASLKECVKEHPKEEMPFFYCENYMADIFGEEGPTKELLDEIINDRPARIQDFSDHACWYNSVAIDMLKNEKGEIDACGPIGAIFKKDANGDYTGHALEMVPDSETAIFSKIGWTPPEKITEEMVMPFIDSLKNRGVCCIMDGYTETEDDLKLFYELDKKGKLKLFYEATCVVGELKDIDETISTVKEWQKKYSTEHINCNIVKYFVEGVNDHGDCLSVEPFVNDPEGKNCGEAYCTAEELKDVILKLNKEKIDLHLHVVCDGGFRLVCDAVEGALRECGGQGGYENNSLATRVTMAHCELIHPDDLKRVEELGIYIDSTCHWSGGYSDEVVQLYQSMERWSRMFDFTKVIAAGGRVGFSSDVYNFNEARRADPFLGMKVAMTRVDPDVPLNPEKYPESVHPPIDGKLNLEQLLNGYISVNAERMRLENKLGSISKGKLANFIIFKDDPFEYPIETFENIELESVYFEGEIIWKKN